MKKITAKSASRKSNRQVATKLPRTTAPTGLFNEDILDEIVDNAEAEEDDENSEMNQTMAILQEAQKRHTKKATARLAAFQNKKKTLSAAARKNGAEVARTGAEYLEAARSEMHDIVNGHGGYQKHLQDLQPLWAANEQSIKTLLAVYPSLTEDLFPRRAVQIDAASKTLMTHPVEREQYLNKFLKNASAQLDRSRENERIATDATTLIRHYKALLLA